jgi:hypothetical protein
MSRRDKQATAARDERKNDIFLENQPCVFEFY